MVASKAFSLLSCPPAGGSVLPGTGKGTRIAVGLLEGAREELQKAAFVRGCLSICLCNDLNGLKVPRRHFHVPTAIPEACRTPQGAPGSGQGLELWCLLAGLSRGCPACPCLLCFLPSQQPSSGPPGRQRRGALGALEAAAFVCAG